MSLSKTELLAEIHASYTALEQALSALTDAQMTKPGPDGWSVKDQLAHVMAWENSMVFLLSHRARHLGLGVDEQMYLSGDFDAINAAIQRLNRDRPLADVLADFRAVHRQMLETLDRLTDADLLKTYSDYLPDEPGRDDGDPILNRIVGNTYEHFDEHRGYIQALVTRR